MSGIPDYRRWLPDRLLNQPNRRVRTRTHGGVTGKAREGSPMSIPRRDSNTKPSAPEDAGAGNCQTEAKTVTYKDLRYGIPSGDCYLSHNRKRHRLPPTEFFYSPPCVRYSSLHC